MNEINTNVKNKDINVTRIQKIRHIQVESIDLTRKGHPNDLILRELALFHYHLGNNKQAMKFIRRSKTVFNLRNSEIADWLIILRNIHDDEIHGNLKSFDDYFKSMSHSTFIENIRNAKNELPILQRVRFFSPY